MACICPEINPYVAGKIVSICDAIGIPQLIFGFQQMGTKGKEPVIIIKKAKIPANEFAFKGIYISFGYGFRRRRYRYIANPMQRKRKKRDYVRSSIRIGDSKGEYDDSKNIYYRDQIYTINKKREVIISYDPRDYLTLAIPFFIAISSQDWAYDIKVSKTSFVLLKLIESMLGSSKIRKQTMDDVIGYDEIKKDLLHIVELRLNVNRISELGLGSRNILLAGNPGCGKSMIMRAIANHVESKRALVINFTGFMNLEEWLPIVSALTKELDTALFVCIDEIDEIGIARDVERTRVYEFLRLMDGLTDLSNVTFIATTNRPQMMDQALLRPERFSPIYLIGLPNKEVRKQLFSHFLEKYRIDAIPSDIEHFAEKTASWTGADIRGVIEDVLYIHSGNSGEIKNSEIDNRIGLLSKEKVKRNNAWELSFQRWSKEAETDVTASYI